jgi:ParB/RepB/Spo0J family partition protein
MQIPTQSILPNPQQPRTEFSETELAGLAASMKENGLLHPVLVEEGVSAPGQSSAYILIDGERRWRAAKMLGWPSIEASVRPAANGTGALERTILALVANLQRADLSPVEEGRGYESLAEMGLSNVAIAHRLGTNVNRVAHRRAILALPEEIQDLMAASLLPIDVRVVAALELVPAEQRVEFARKLARPGLKIKSVQVAAEKLRDALAAARVEDDPSIFFAHRRAGKPDLPAWDALHQLGKLPPWQGVVEAAHRTCRACELREEASAVVCERCPAVTMLVEMMRNLSYGKP